MKYLVRANDCFIILREITNHICHGKMYKLYKNNRMVAFIITVNLAFNRHSIHMTHLLKIFVKVEMSA